MTKTVKPEEVPELLRVRLSDDERRIVAKIHDYTPHLTWHKSGHIWSGAVATALHFWDEMHADKV